MQFVNILQTLSISHAEFFAKVIETSAKFCVVQTLKLSESSSSVAISASPSDGGWSYSSGI